MDDKRAAAKDYREVELKVINAYYDPRSGLMIVNKNLDEESKEALIKQLMLMNDTANRE